MNGFLTKALISGAALLALSACETAEKPTNYLTLTAVEYDDLPGWTSDDLTEALPAFEKSCQKIIAMPFTKSMGYDDKAGRASDWYAACRAVRDVPARDNGAARAYFEQWFQPWRAAAGERGDGLFTGYYQAELRGSLKRGGKYKWPIYARPYGLSLDPAKGGAPWFSRAEIEKGAIAGKADILLWVDDPVDAHILHIQGSGLVRMDDGSVVSIGFDGSNGQPFLGLGRILLDQGKLQPGNVSMQSVKAWLKTHPDEAPALMAMNKRYIFFRFIKGEGAIGAAGVTLTAKRSMAVDPAFIGFGTPLWLDAKDPDGKPLLRLMIAQDAGAAIKGPVRGDFYWGPGEEAFEMAGRMKSRGVYYLLLPRWRSAQLALVD